MIWAVLALIGVPLWLCALGILALVFRNRRLRKRPGSVPVRVREEGQGRWRPGHAVWVHDVFAFRGSPAAWKETLFQARSIADVHPRGENDSGIHRLGDNVVIATLSLVPGGKLQVAARAEQQGLLTGPFGERAPEAGPPPVLRAVPNGASSSS